MLGRVSAGLVSAGLVSCKVTASIHVFFCRERSLLWYRSRKVTTLMEGGPLSVTQNVFSSQSRDDDSKGRESRTSMAGRSLVTLDDISTGQILELIHKARYIESNREKVAGTCNGRVLATLFYEPSTRTRLSFETAMLRLGGHVVGFPSAKLSSATKGETVYDTLKVVSNYADVVAIRHPKEGAVLVAADAADVPVINAGDGGHMHPTQTLADLATLDSRLGRFTDITIGLCGDLRFGRTVHSLIETLCRFGGVRFVLISPEELRTPRYVRDIIDASATCSYVETGSLTDVIGDLDALYMTRVQQERFENESDYLRLRDTYVLDTEKMTLAKPNMPVLHPLPRVNEIARDVDKDPRAAYFEQTRQGMLMRMALESSVLGDELAGYDPLGEVDLTVHDDGAQNGQDEGSFARLARSSILIDGVCPNPHCITTSENGLEQRCYRIVTGDDVRTGAAGRRCVYCDAELD